MNDSSSAATAKPNNQSSLTAATTGIAGECDAEVWEIFNSSFSQVQAVLDRNRVLIRQVNENHQSKIPDNMVKNVALIQELNANISKVVSLYSDLSTNFSSAFHLRSRTSHAVDGSPDPSPEG
ncbi:hypothetical protein MLD38_018889 [Melastoma candidum]|uniref:Uncharacterized protein n=1 Tax=Melastoma candidum TaxID=119954 RepID=A0ACB9QVD7_9MYRT|nr:hypothetical protein MLD38_018889 [Melastoma candidum]